MKTIPSGDATTKTQNALAGFSDAEIKEFAGFLWSRSNPKSGGLPSSGAAGKLFSLKPDGAGRGEIYLAALCKNSYIQGSSESFDLQTSSTKYEVKDYSKLGGSIRAGVEAAISKFHFWKQILKTVDVIRAVEKEKGWDYIPDSSEKTEILSIKKYILSSNNLPISRTLSVSGIQISVALATMIVATIATSSVKALTRHQNHLAIMTVPIPAKNTPRNINAPRMLVISVVAITAAIMMTTIAILATQT